MNVNEYARLQQRPLPPLRKLVRAVLHSMGVPITPGQVEEVALRLWRPTIKARGYNYQASVRYLQDLQVPMTIPAVHNYPFQAVTSVIERAVEGVKVHAEPVTESNRTDIRAIEQARTPIEGAIVRQALAPARDTVASIGEDQRQPHIRWARVLVGPSSCAFCAMLASRGAVYKSEQSATGRGGASLSVYHAPPQGGVCDCIAQPVVEGRPWEGQQAHEELDALWQDHGNLKAFRGAWNKQVAEGKTDKFLPASVQPA